MTRKVFFLICLMTVAGCTTPVFHHDAANRHVVVLDRQPISVLNTGEDSWQAWGGSTRPSGNEQFSRQVKAIEIVSGCSVQKVQVDPEDKRKLTAQVKCEKVDLGI